MNAPSPVDAQRLRECVIRAAHIGVIVRAENDDFLGDYFVATKLGLKAEFTDLDSLERWLDLVAPKPTERKSCI